MTRLTSVHSRRTTATLTAPSSASRLPLVLKLWRELWKDLLSSYRPELHYMRGPGPRWKERHGDTSRRGGGTQASAQDLRTDAPGMFASRLGAQAAGPRPSPWDRPHFSRYSGTRIRTEKIGPIAPTAEVQSSPGGAARTDALMREPS